MFNKNKKEQSTESPSIITKETIGFTLGVFSVLMLLISITGSLLFGDLGVSITSFLLGAFGFLTYPVLLCVLYLSITLIIGKNLIPSKGLTASGFCTLALLGLLLHAVFTSSYPQASFGAYLSACFEAGNLGVLACSPFGVVGGIIVYPVVAVATSAGAYILFAAGIGLSGYIFVNSIILRKNLLTKDKKDEKTEKTQKNSDSYAQTKRSIAFEDLENNRTPRTAEEFSTPQTYAENAYNANNSYGVVYDRKKEIAPSAPTYAPENGTSFLQDINRGESAYESSKKILYGPQVNPAEYRSRNLIFDGSSQYNNRAKTAEPSTGAPITNQASASADYANNEVAYTESYSQMYSQEIDQKNSTASAERKILQTGEDLPRAGYSMYKKDVYETYRPAEDFEIDAPVRPSYKAPEPVLPPTPSTQPTPPAYTQERVSLRDRFNADRASTSYQERQEQSFNAQEQSFTGREQSFNAQEQSFTGRDQSFNTQEQSFIGRDQSFTGRENLTMSKESTAYDRRRIFDEEFDFADDEQEEVVDFRIDEKRGNERASAGLSSALRNTLSPRESNQDVVPPARETHFNPPQREETARQITPREVPAQNSYTPAPATPAQNLYTSAPVPPTPAKPAPAKPRVFKDYVRPSLDLFASYDDSFAVNMDEIEKHKRGIIETLAGFNIACEVERVTSGPSFTRYDITIPKNVTAKTIARYADNIAMSLHARAAVNIYSNFSQGTIAIEVPNSKRSTVGMRNMLQSPEYINAKPGSLTFCVGKDVEGKSVCCSLTKMPHMLVAGATGSGKSVFLNELIISLIIKYSPEELRLILVDPKQIEFAPYDRLPHLMINEIIADVNKTIVTLNWAINEMERRYTLFRQMTSEGKTVRNLEEYNAAQTDRNNKIPVLVIIVDELADLMNVAKKDIEDRIGRIAAKARAAGIHLVLATQRPSVDVITGVLKSNLPSRFAFRVASEVDSRVILDETGAENLLGAGDLLYKTGSMFGVERVQAAWLDSGEIQRVCDFIRKNNEAYYDESVSDFINNGGKSSAEGENGGGEGDGEVEPVYIDALRYVVQSGSASISMIQRKCSVGYNKAGKIIEWMEISGYISPFEGAKSRKVLLSADDFRAKYGEL